MRIRVAIPVADVTDYVWIYDLIRHEGRKISAGGSAGWPVWWPDGQSLVATRFGIEEPGLYRLSAGDGGVAPKLLWPDKASLRSGGMSKDGSKILVRVADTGSGQLGLLSTAAGGHLERLPIPGNIGTPALSPDGRYAAYTSDESGQNEVWVRSLSGEGGATQISVDGALEALWLKDQLFYRKGRQWFAAKFTEVKSKLVFQSPKLVFETDFVDTPGRSYAVSPDGQRLLVVKNAHEPIRNKIMIVQNWRKAPEANSK